MNRIIKGSITTMILVLLIGCSQVPHPQVTSLEPPEPAASASPTAAAAEVPINLPGCTVQTRRVQPDPTEESLLPAISPEDWIKGSRDASVTILEYSDFQ